MIRIVKRKHVDIVGEEFEIFSVHQNNLCIDIPHTMKDSNEYRIQNYIDSMIERKIDFSKCKHK
jgi:hypothetical protein